MSSNFARQTFFSHLVLIMLQLAFSIKHARKHQENSNTNTSNYDCISLDGTSNFGNRSISAPQKDKDCKDIQFHPFESDRAITIGTSQHEYSVEIDYLKDTGGFEPNPYFKNVAAE